MKYRYIFGPVPSRRLGVSLGVDLVPYKTCTLDCIYCECGKTTDCTLERKEYVFLDAVKAELNDYLDKKPELDFITFSGSGEPTLHSGLGEIIDFLKTNHPRYRLCLLTNGTLFTDPALRTEVRKLDLIVPSLDAATQECFREINRPHPGLDCPKVIEGLAALRAEYTGILQLEIFIAPGFNDSKPELDAIKQAINIIKPDLVQLGTLDRPGTEEWLKKAGSGKMQEIADYLGPAELIGKFKPGPRISSFDDSHNRQILQTLQRRPCTAKDLQILLGLRPAEIQKYINHLLNKEKIEVVKQERGSFLKIKKAAGK